MKGACSNEKAQPNWLGFFVEHRRIELLTF